MSDFSGIQYLLEKHAPPKKPRLPDATEIRVAAAQQVLHKRNGRGWRVPLYVVNSMRKEWEKLRSLRKTGALFGVHGSNVGKLLKRNGMAIRPNRLHPTLEYRGQKYRYDGSRYYVKCGAGASGVLLHKVIWEERNGPVPKDHWIVFRTENKADFSPENMYLLPRKEYFAHILKTRWDKHRARQANAVAA